MVASFFADVTAFVAAHPYLAYAVVFLLAASESIPVVGAFIPGTAAILAISALVPTGIVKLWPLLGAATAGAIIGDGFAFWIGHRYHREILARWPLNRYRSAITRSEAFFARHGDKSVFIARFTPGVRAFIPFIAGMLRMLPRRFYAANILSALVWAPSHILSAVLVGAAFSVFGTAAKPLAILVVLIAVVIWAVKHLVRFALLRGPRLQSKITAWVRTRAIVSESRWSRFVFNLLDLSRPDAWGLALLAFVLIGSAWIFLGVLEDVVSGDSLVRADSALYHAFQDLRSAPGDAAMLAITELGDTVVVVAVTSTVFLWLWWKGAWRSASFLLLAVAGASALNTAIKVALHRARPGELFYTGWSAFSFPSGHSTVNLVLYGFLAVLIGRELPPTRRLLVSLAAAVLALLIAVSRLYLGAHWFSDVVGGLAFGSAWLAILSFFYLRKQGPPIGAAGSLIVSCATLFVAGGLNVYRHHALDVERYALKSTTPVMRVDDWWSAGWQQLPARRVDITGEIEEPLTLQWAGDLPSIQRALLAKGWRSPPPWMSLKALGWLTTKAAPADLPVIPRLASGRLPSLTLIQSSEAGQSRLVLRLWRVDLTLTNQTASPVWVGSVVDERLQPYFTLFILGWTQADMVGPRSVLAGELESARVAARPDVTADAEWDGRVLLLRQGAP